MRREKSEASANLQGILRPTNVNYLIFMAGNKAYGREMIFPFF